MATGGGLIGALPAAPNLSVSTIAANGDGTPYGVAKVAGGFLVTDIGNFVGSTGEGGAIEKVFLNGSTKTWYTTPKGLSLTGAITVLANGDVVVGVEPSGTNGPPTQGRDSLMVLNRAGREIADLAHLNLPLSPDGVLSLAAGGRGANAKIFVSDSTNETITRVNLAFHGGVPRVASATTIANDYAPTLLPPVPSGSGSTGHWVLALPSSQATVGSMAPSSSSQSPGSVVHPGPGVSIVAITGQSTVEAVPTSLGLAFDAKTKVLYVTSGGDGSVYAVASAATRTTAVEKGAAVEQNTFFAGVPIVDALAPNGDLLVADNGGLDPFSVQPSPLIEYTTGGRYVDSANPDPNSGAISGIVASKIGNQTWLVSVNELANTLEIRKASK